MAALQELIERGRRVPQWLIDAALVLAVTGARVVQVEVETGHEPAVQGAVLFVVAVVGATPLFFRRRYPFAVLLVIGAFELALLVFDIHGAPFSLLVAAYTAAACCSPAAARLALVGGLSLLMIALVGLQHSFVIETPIAYVLAWALGALQRARREHTVEAERRLELLERDRERERVIAVAEERSRIARELHDVIAHGLGVMVIQATAATRSLSSNQERARSQIEEVGRTGRESLAEMRRLLSLLGAGEPADLAPQPGLAHLDELLERYRRADLPVELRVEGERRPLPSTVELSAYRIVQEALTNVLKHAGQVPVTVTLRYQPDELGIQVLDGGNGRRPSWSPQSSGRGLIGMRERAALLGGQIDARPNAGGGFRVDCSLPLSKS